jgi:hypothetical protein
LTNSVTPYNTAQSIAASMSSASVQTSAQLTAPNTTNQTLLSLLSTGQVSMQSPSSLVQQAGLVPAGLANAPVASPPAQGAPATQGGGNVNPAALAPVTLDEAIPTGVYGGT